MGLLNLFRKKSKETARQADCRFPLAELNRHVGQIIEVHHLDSGQEKIEKARLVFPASENGFYLGEFPGYHLINWDRADHDGRKFAVEKIIDSEGKIIYSANGIHFDYNKLEESK